MNCKLILLICVFAAFASVRAEWAVEKAHDETAATAGLVHRQISLEDARSGDSATMELALFSSKAPWLRVIDNPTGGNDLAQTMRSHECSAGVNGAYFDESFAPLGLRIIDGQVTSSLRQARLLTGILICSREGIQILRLSEYSSKRVTSCAIQCGPLLVDGGHAVKGLDRTRVARRTFVALGGDRAALGFCSEISLGELAQVLSGSRLAENWKIKRALNLDGGSSSAFWFKRSNGSAFSIVEYKNVRDFVGIAPPKKD